MARTAPFKFLVNTGYEDDLLIAAGVLQKKISEIMKNPSGTYNRELNELDKSHIVMINGTYKPHVPIHYEYTKTSSTGNLNFKSEVEFDLPKIGDFCNDAVIHIRLSGLAAVSSPDKVRYVKFLGHRIIKKLTLSINNNILDEISTENFNIYYQFHVPANKKAGWLKNVGQEVPHMATLTANPLADEYQQILQISDGNQTFKNSHDIVDLWIPIPMWFANTKTPFPMLLIKHGQNRIKLEFPSVDQIVSYADYGGGGTYIPPKITVCDLYMNNLSLLPQLQSLFVRSFAFNLVRVHRGFNKILINPKDRILLSSLKYPIENLYIAFRPVENFEDSQNWDKNMILTEKKVKIPVIIDDMLAFNNAKYYTEEPVISDMKLTLDTVDLFPYIDSQFYNSYTPYRFGKNINTPDYNGWFFVPFGLEPGEFSPNGYLNIDKARELYLDYNSDTSKISKDKQVYLFVAADCINFLYIQNQSAVLRFS